MVEPHLSFRDAALKIIWAGELRRQLHARFAAFADTKPYEVTLEHKPDEGGYAFGAKITQPLPYEIPCLIGDVCHNLRASLDFCFMGLKRSLDPESKRTGNVPFGTNRKDCKGTVRKVFEPIASAPVVDALTELFCDTIKTHQDFPAGGNWLLYALNDLSNWQKHNMLIATPCVTKLAQDATLISDDGSRATCGGAKIGSNAIFLSGNVSLHQSGDPTIEIVIEGEHLARRRDALPLLADFEQATIEALKAFCEAFPSADNPKFV